MSRRETLRTLSKKDWKNIRAATKKILLSGKILQHERQDVEQEIAVTLWKESRNFRSRQSSWASFSHLVIENCLKKIIRHRLRPSSRYRYNPSLSLNMSTECPGEPDSDSEIIEQVNCERLLEDGSSNPEHPGLFLKIDAHEFIAGLPGDLKSICEALKTMHVSDAARTLGISRTTLYAKLKDIRKGMIDSGFAAYF